MTGNSELRRVVKPIMFMKIAEMLGNLSYDEKHQVGSILVKKDFKNIHAIGYNGNFVGGKNERDSMEHGKSGYLHAEENVIINKSLSFEIIRDYYDVFVTMTPCNMCAKRLVGIGATRVFYHKDYVNCGNTQEIFNKAKVELIRLEDHIKDKFKDLYKPEFDDKTYENQRYSFIDSYNLVKEELPKYFETNPKLLPSNFMDMITTERKEGETSYEYFLNIMYDMLYKFVGIEYGKY